MRKAWGDVWRFFTAVADRARFYLACVAEGDIHDCCLIVLVFGLLFLAIILGAWFLTLGWVGKVVGN